MLLPEWAARQNPIDMEMSMCIERQLRSASPAEDTQLLLPAGAKDALVRVHASAMGDRTKALAVFDEFVQATCDSRSPSEGSLVGMVYACVEAKITDLAEHILGWARTQKRCTLPIFAAESRSDKQGTNLC